MRPRQRVSQTRCEWEDRKGQWDKETKYTRIDQVMATCPTLEIGQSGYGSGGLKNLFDVTNIFRFCNDNWGRANESTDAMGYENESASKEPTNTSTKTQSKTTQTTSTYVDVMVRTSFMDSMHLSKVTLPGKYSDGRQVEGYQDSSGKIYTFEQLYQLQQNKGNGH